MLAPSTYKRVIKCILSSPKPPSQVLFAHSRLAIEVSPQARDLSTSFWLLPVHSRALWPCTSVNRFHTTVRHPASSALLYETRQLLYSAEALSAVQLESELMTLCERSPYCMIVPHLMP